jgi:predicted methyltransferase
MARTFLAVLAAAVVLGVSGGAVAQPAPAYVAAAVADPGRPAEDTARDSLRKPAEVVAFAGIKPGEKVYELLPGGGYFTRILSKVVGPGGHLYAAVPDRKSAFAEPAADKIAADPAYANVSVVIVGPSAMAGLPPLDAIWTSDNYHDLHLSQVHIDVPALDRQWFAALKSGGVLLIIDHVALPGSPATETADKLHRIDPAIIRQEVESAGFRFDGEIDALRNPADPHTALVFDPSIRGHTDQVVYKFRKP